MDGFGVLSTADEAPVAPPLAPARQCRLGFHQAAAGRVTAGSWVVMERLP